MSETIPQLIERLNSHDIRLWSEEGRLRFSAPSGGFPDELKSAVRDRKSDILTFLNSISNGQSGGSIPRVSRDGELRLSPAQERLWFLHRLEGDNGAYNIPAAFRIRGALDVNALERCFFRLRDRHEILSMKIDQSGGNPVFTRSDRDGYFQRLPCKIQSVRQMVESEANAPFDLERGPLIRVRLFEISEAEFFLSINLHHIIGDGWSLDRVIAEIGDSYRELLSGNEATVIPLPIQFIDYAAWERYALEAGVEPKIEEYWRNHLRGVPSTIPLPHDHTRPLRPAFRGANHEWPIPREIRVKLEAVAESSHAGVFASLLSVFQLVLHTYSQQKDFVIGTPVAHRTRPEAQELIGFFVNTLVVRSALGIASTFRGLLCEIQKATLGMLEHQDVPFEKLLEFAGVDRDLSRAPLAQVFFSYNSTAEPLKLDGVEVTPLTLDYPFAKFDLTLEIEPVGENFQCRFNYDSDLFDRETIVRIAQLFESVTRQVVAEPDINLGSLRLLSSQDECLLREWNQTDKEFPLDSTIVSAFESQVDHNPDLIAVRRDRELTYRELDSRANQLARFLVRKGIRTDVPVGIHMSRGCDMVVALLGVLKAGGAYLPLDPSYPQDRLLWMIEDSECPVILSDGNQMNGGFGNAETVNLRENADEVFNGDSTPINRPIDTNSLAYVIYTSGSTGKPKGVMITHRNVVNFFAAMDDVVGTEPGIWLASTSISFDISVLELFWTLTRGFTVVIAASIEDSLPDLIVRESVTHFQCTPSHAQMLIGDEVKRAALGKLKTVLIGGEAMPMSLLRTLQTICKGRLINVYGPTETTIWSTSSDVTNCKGNVTIGRPVANNTVHVLNSDLKQVPTGVAGEMFIGGEGVARGYLNRPDLTNERFIPDPFSNDEGARMYRTGDLVRWLASGEIEFLGRNDFQVKVRGHRIELGEIEEALGGFEEVDQAVVLARPGSDGALLLVAYLCCRGGMEFSRDVVSENLRQHLPDYMVPSIFVILDAFPQTPNGKVDRGALPEPQNDSVQTRESLMPSGTVEITLAAIWKELLNNAETDANTSFFSLGGHSLLVTRMLFRIRESLGVDLPLRAVFEAPTISALAARIRDADRTATTDAPAIQKQPDRSDFPLSFSQERIYFLDRLDEGDPSYNIPVAWRIRGSLDQDQLERAVNSLIESEEILRTTLRETGSELRQIVNTHVPVALKSEPMPASDDKSLALVLRDAACRLFDLETGPLYEWKLLSLGDDDHVLFLNHHHAISDRVSITLIEERLSAFYRGVSLAEESNVQFGDVAAWQREQWDSGIWKSQVEYWKSKFAEQVSPLNLPLDHPRPPRLTYEGASVRSKLSADAVSAIHSLSEQFDASFFMVNMAIFGALMSRYADESDVVVGTPVANRGRSETETVIGFLVNTLAIRLNIPKQCSVSELMHDCRTTVLEAFENQDVPFDRVVEELRIDRDLARQPLFQVMLVVDESSDSELSLRDASISQIDVPTTTSKFDLTFFVLRTAKSVEIVTEYNQNLFESSTIERWVGHFGTLIAAAAADVSRPVASIELLSDSERNWLLHGFNQTDRTWDEFFPIHRIISNQTARSPDAIAIEDANGSVTYSQLESRSNRLAHWLIDTGVESESLVGLYLPRSVEALVAILGVLKAGAAYVPLDCLSPPFRTRQILTACDSPLVLTVSDRVNDLDGIESRVVDIGSIEHSEFSTEPSSVPDEMERLAYVIFTSGSTGAPKGVQIEHRGLSNYLLWACEAYDAQNGCGSIVHSSIAFDLTITGLFLPLMAGKTVRMVPDGEQSFTELLTMLGRSQNLSVLKITPAHLDILSNEITEEQTRDLCAKYVIGGENLLGSQLEWWQQSAPNSTFVNEYGPTETVVGCCVFEANARDCFNGSVPIGKPIANTRLYVLDEALHPVPRGLRGELFIGGAGVARGYLNQRALTAKRFVPDPFTKETGARMYRTGDKVQMRSDGNLEFVGRSDHQVKIRGFRVELAEIESAIREFPGIEDVAAVFRNDRDEQCIDVFITHSAGKGAFDQGALTGWVGGRLPVYMQPSSISVLDKLPLTLNGKLDRAALPETPITTNPTTSDTPETATDLERKLIRAWASLLPVGEIGLDDNFFQIGGHSLLALKLVRRLRDELKIEVPIRYFFEYPTIRRLAEKLEPSRSSEELATNSWRYLVPLQLKGNRRPLFLFPGGIGSEREFLVFARLAGFVGEEQPIFGLRATDAQGDDPVHRSVAQMAEDYVREIRAMQPEGPYLFLGECVGGIVAFEAARQLAEQGEHVSHFILLDSDCPRPYDYALSRISVAWLRFRRHWLIELVTRSFTHLFRLIRLKPSEGWAYIKNKGRMGMKRVDQAMLARDQTVESELLTPSEHHYFRTLIQYRPQTYRGNICLMMSEQMKKSPRAMSWAEWVDGGIDVRHLEGDHFSYIRENAPKTAEEIGKYLES